jgi:hypothetical protein
MSGNDASDVFSMDEFFAPEKVDNAILDYRRLDLKTATLSQVRQCLDPAFGVIVANHVCNLGLPLFRVRPLESDEEHSEVVSLLAPPPHKVHRMGRLNDAGESMLYAAFDPVTAIRESRIRGGQRFSLTVLSLAQRPVFHNSSIRLGLEPPSCTKRLSAAMRASAERLHLFIRSEITKTVGVGDEHEYKATCVITQFLLGDPNKDSIVYPSVFDPNRTNIALTIPGANERTTVWAVFECQLLTLGDAHSGEVPTVKATRQGTPYNGGQLLYLPLSSPNDVCRPPTGTDKDGTYLVQELLRGRDPWPKWQRVLESRTTDPVRDFLRQHGREDFLP